MEKLEQVATSDRYAVIPRVLIFPIDEEGRVLLIKGAPTKRIWANLWNGIGGHIQPGESIKEAALRELTEETGLHAARLEFRGQVMVDTGTHPGISFHIFIARLLEGELTPSTEGDLQWFEPESALKLPLVEDLYTLMPIILRGMGTYSPFWGLYSYDKADQLIMRFSG